MEYEAYLFDMDGTLVSTEKLKGEAMARACNELGGNVTLEIYKSVMGRSGDVVRDYFILQGNIHPDIHEFDSIFNKHYLKLLSGKIELTPGALTFLNLLKNKKTALVSSSKTWMIRSIVEKLDLGQYFDTIIANEDVRHQKPNPEAYLLAQERLEVVNQPTLVFEDSYAGIMAAHNAGCKIVGVRHYFNQSHDMSKAEAVITNYQELLKNDGIVQTRQ